VDQKVAPNKNYCRSVTIQTLGLKAIAGFGTHLFHFSLRSYCTPTLAG
jgi:hypothetical protein